MKCSEILGKRLAIINKNQYFKIGILLIFIFCLKIQDDHLFDEHNGCKDENRMRKWTTFGILVACS